ncbi:MAG TPA: DUF2784 domain-containing protein [Stellaceae bacterium]|jgi:hypothetical protein|nr:DUF2784 domain-containing protein [Stellaceae bacterium]
MERQLLSILASTVLAIHLGVILFNIFGLVAIPLGAWRGWRFVRVFWWRALHLAVLAVVALQALLDRACFLTLWQYALRRGAGEGASPAPLIESWVNRLIFWPLPMWFFAALYVGVWIYALLLWRLVPPVLPGRTRRIIPRRRPPPA